MKKPFANTLVLIIGIVGFLICVAIGFSISEEAGPLLAIVIWIPVWLFIKKALDELSSNKD